MQLRSSPKVNGKGVHRVLNPADTLRRASRVAGRVGVTRLADITGLDRLGIPTYSSVVPRSRDVLSIYNGKGVTKTEAKAGALMEAIERHAALNIQKKITYGAYGDLSQERRALDPKSPCITLHPEYADDKAIAWVEGFDLLSEERVLVPMELASYYTVDKRAHRSHAVATTNGLASGNSLEEAVCHALCELIERDAWTLAELLSHVLPYADRRRRSQQHQMNFGSIEPDQTNDGMWDDVDRYPNIDLDGAGAPIQGLLRRFERAGLQPVVKDITSDLGIATVLCTVAEEVYHGFPRAHFGLGTHPDARVAITRALTEVAQSRVVDIQGVREDLGLAIGDHPYPAHTKRVSEINRRSWYHARSARVRRFADIQSYVHSDILDDISLMLRRICESGIGQVVVVDLTLPDIDVPVVRVLVPGLESWAADHMRIGWRATNIWRKNMG